MKQRWFYDIFRWRVLIIILISLQALFFVQLILVGSHASTVFSRVLSALSLFAVLYIVSRKDKGAYKTMWVFLILLLPLFGGLLYLIFSFQTDTRRFRRRISDAERKASPLYLLPGDGYDKAKQVLGHQFPQVRYLQDFMGFPVYSETAAEYFPSGERMFEALLRELEKAERYIFLEFFIVQEGHMWDSILDILRKKAAAGVKVRLLYDDIGCFLLLPKDYPKRLAGMGIECAVFNPFRPLLTVRQNNRDHRKIVSIDGKTAFTGGVNLADEYINAKAKHGHWKDAGIAVKGKAAWSFTLFFLQMWELAANAEEDFSGYYPWHDVPCDTPSDGFFQPYADSPMDRENVGEHVYLQIIGSAERYVYINTPYLIVDDSVLSALMLAAKRGVDVMIITPHRWDKRLVHITTRSYYRELVNAGVRIYEYKDGFNHSKTFVSDDTVATVGTTNLDFRSLYLHFECGVLIFRSKAISAVKDDFLKTLQVSRPILAEDCRESFPKRLFQDVLRLFAPLM